jgi:hypothetical protein
MDVLAILKQKSRPVYTVNNNQPVDDDELEKKVARVLEG